LSNTAKIALTVTGLGLAYWIFTQAKAKASEWANKINFKVTSFGKPALSPGGKLSVPLQIRITNIAPIAVPLDNAKVKLFLLRNGIYTPIGETDPTGPVNINASGDTAVTLYPHIDINKLRPVIGNVAETITNLINNTSALLDLKAESEITIQGYVIAQSTSTKVYLKDVLNLIKGNGLGMVPTGKRTVSPVPASLKAMVPRPTGNNEVVKQSGADPYRDTVPLIQRLVKRQLWQGKKLAQALKGKTVEETVRNDWDFFIKHIQYQQDAEGKEQVRSLRRTVHSGAGDCDDYVCSLSNILTNQGIDHKLRVTAYNGDTNPSHIYIIVPTSAGKHITLDPVVHKFNYEVPFTSKTDFKNAA